MGAPPAAQGGATAPRQGLAIASLVLGVLSIPTLGCLGVGALLGVALGILALTRSSRAPADHGGRGMAIAGIAASALSLVLAVPLGAILAAIAIPSFLRARVSANEAAAIGAVRTVLSAQAAYHAASCGVHGRLECLHAPSSPGCLPGYTGPTFLDPSNASLGVRGGYRRSFHPGPELTVAPQPGCTGGSGPGSFAFVAEPENPKRTGVRTFCGDDTGRVCATADRLPPVENGRCPQECTDLR